MIISLLSRPLTPVSMPWYSLQARAAIALWDLTADAKARHQAHDLAFELGVAAASATAGDSALAMPGPLILDHRELLRAWCAGVVSVWTCDIEISRIGEGCCCEPESNFQCCNHAGHPDHAVVATRRLQIWLEQSGLLADIAGSQ